MKNKEGNKVLIKAKLPIIGKVLFKENGTVMEEIGERNNKRSDGNAIQQKNITVTGSQ